MAAMNSGLRLALALTLMAASIWGYTDPVMSPTTVTDDHGNTADSSSKITWVPIPDGAAYKHTDPPAQNPIVVGFLGMVRGFTHMLQPADLPYELISGLIDGTLDIMENAKDLGMYMAGFGVCIVIGILFMIVMPIVCCCFCCCRMCGKCGGKRTRPDPDVKARCRCVTFTLLLFVVTANIITGASMVYLMDAEMTSSFQNVANATSSNLEDIGTFLTNMVDELEYTAVEGFQFTGSVVKRDLNNIGAIFGMAVKEAFNADAGVNVAIQSILDMDTSMDQSEADMTAVNASQVLFETELDNMNIELGDVDAAITTMKANGGCKASCLAIDQTLLVAGIDKTNLPNVTVNLISIRALQAQDLTKSALDGKKNFDEIPDQITNDTKQNVQDMIKMIDDFEITIADSLDQMDALTSGQDMLDSQAETLTSYTDMLNTYNKPRSYAFYGLAGFLACICLFFILGLLLGCCGFKDYRSPAERSSVSNCGGQCLMAGVGFCFIFSWLLMLLVTLPFMIGAPLDRFLCEPLMDPEFKIFTEFLDKPDGPLGKGYFLGGMLLQNDTIPITISGVLMSCQNNTAAYKALSLEYLFDITEVTDYKSEIDIESEIANMDSDMSGIQVMSDDTRQILLDFQTAVVVDYNAYQTELAKDLGSANFQTLSDSLRSIASDGTNTAPINTQLLTQADNLDNIITVNVPSCETQKAELLDDVNVMEQSGTAVPVAIDDVIASTEETEDFIQNNGSYVVKKQASAYGARILGTIDQYVDFVVTQLNTNIGGCEPLWNVWQFLIHDTICNSLILILNGFWFALGWAVFFMVPAIIFGVRLAKYLRRMSPDESLPGRFGMVSQRMERSNKVDQDPYVISSPPPAYTTGAKPSQSNKFATEEW